MRLTKTPAEQHEFNLRRYTPHEFSSMDPLYNAAQFITEQAAQLAAADARNKILEAELTTMRADRDRLATKVQTVAELLEPRTWADNSRNHTLLAAAIYDGVPRKENA